MARRCRARPASGAGAVGSPGRPRRPPPPGAGRCRRGRRGGRLAPPAAVAVGGAALAVDQGQDVGAGDAPAGAGALDRGSGRGRARRSGGARRVTAPCSTRRPSLGRPGGRLAAGPGPAPAGGAADGRALRPPPAGSATVRWAAAASTGRRRRPSRGRLGSRAVGAGSAAAHARRPRPAAAGRPVLRPSRSAGAAGGAAAAAGAVGGDHGQPGPDIDRVALGHQDLGHVRRRPARGPRSRPCRSRPRTARRPRRPGRPTCFSHRVMVPSVTVSPSWGIVMSANVHAPSGEGEHRLAEVLRQRRMGLDEVGHLVRRSLPS